MFGYCGVTDDKIHFGVPVSKEQNMFSLLLIKTQCCVCLTWHLWDNHVEFRNRMVHEVLMHVSIHLDEKLLGCGITKTRKIEI